MHITYKAGPYNENSCSFLSKFTWDATVENRSTYMNSLISKTYLVLLFPSVLLVSGSTATNSLAKELIITTLWRCFQETELS